MLWPEAPPVATRVPVGPTAAQGASARAWLSFELTPLGDTTSTRSVIVAGGAMVVLPTMSETSTSIVSAVVVVIDGAVIEADDDVARPPWASIGVTGSTPL